MKTIAALLGILMLCAFTGNTSWEGMDRKEYDRLMNKCDSFYKAQKNFEVRVTHISFRGHDAVTPYETSFGKSVVAGSNSYHGILGVHTIQTPQFKIILDSTSRTMFLDNGAVADKNQLPSFAELNVQQYITGYKKASRENKLLIHVDYDKGPAYEAHELVVAPNGLIEQVAIYYRKAYSTDVNNPNAPKAKPKLVVKYDRFSTKVNVSSALFNANTYYRINKGTATPSAAFQGWKFHDIRIKK